MLRWSCSATSTLSRQMPSSAAGTICSCSELIFTVKLPSLLLTSRKPILLSKPGDSEGIFGLRIDLILPIVRRHLEVLAWYHHYLVVTMTDEAPVRQFGERQSGLWHRGDAATQGWGVSRGGEGGGSGSGGCDWDGCWNVAVGSAGGEQRGARRPWPAPPPL